MINVTDQANIPVTQLEPKPVPSSKLILSLYPGIDLFSKPFEALGFSVVRGPDLLLGQDIRDFHVPAGVFAGIIGGSPCPEFSGLRRLEPTGEGLELLGHYQRIVTEADCNWWLLENVARVPDLKINGWSWQRFDLNQAWFTNVSRLRHFQFGSKAGLTLNPPKFTGRSAEHAAAVASDDRSFEHLKYCQGLPADFDLPSFTVEGKKRAVGNGVPLVLGSILAHLINETVYGVTRPADLTVTHLVHSSVTKPGQVSVTSRPFQSVTDQALYPVTLRVEICDCGCGRVVTGKAKYASAACRKRSSRRNAA